MLKPMFDRILVKPVEMNKTPGGLFIPETTKERPKQGEVIAVGDGKEKESGGRTKMDVSVGDKIIYGKFTGSEITYDNQTYLIMKQEDVLAVL